MKWLLDLIGVNNSFTHLGTLMYNFWSGIGLTVFLPGVYLYHHNCHVRGCHRMGHSYNGVVYCKKHSRKTA
jgi:hypothetical protein